MSSFLRPFLSVVLLLALLALSACSGAGRIRYDSPDDAYAKGLRLFEEGKYERAVPFFQGVFDYGRTSEVAADAQLYLARAHFEARDYILAASEYSRFVNTYRTNPNVEAAMFERAVSYHHLSPQYALDQTNTRQAITYLQLFLDRFPDSDLKGEAEEYLRVLREKLARKAYESAGLYERRGIYEAAALSYERVFDTYPDTQWADDALLGAMRSYLAFADLSIESRQPERLQLAIDNYTRLVELFRDSPLVKEAETFYETASGRLAELASNATS